MAKGAHLVLLFSLLLISACYGITYPFSCTTSNLDGASNAYAACDEPLTLNPVTRQQAPSFTAYNNFGDPIPLTTTHGDSVAIFDNLVYGNTYLFSTCDLNGESPFDTVIIIRSPTGAVLRGNDDCTSSITCTVTSYTHTSIAFGSIHVSVYKKTPDREQGTFLCSTASSGSKALATFFAAVSGSPAVTSCDFKLTCNPTLILNQGSSFTSSNLIDSGNSDLCGVSNSGIPFVDEEDGYTTTSFINNCDYGTRSFSISVYGETCETEVTFVPSNPSVGCDGYTTYVYPNHLLTTCSFGYPCAIDTSDYRPDIYVNDYCGSSKRSMGYTANFDPDTVYASIGDTVDYDVSVLTDEEGYGSNTCSVELLGIVPEALYSFVIAPDGTAYYPDEPQYIFNDDVIYYDTIYRMEFYFDFGDSGFITPLKRGLDSNGFGIYLYSPSGFLGDEYNDEVYAQIDIAEFDYPWCGFGKRDVGNCDNCCYSVVDFCIPSTVSTRDIGDFQSGNMYKILIAAPIYSGSKRTPGSPFDSYYISLGNPYVALSVDPRRENTTPDCAAFSSRDSNFNWP